jgi:tRNA-splicing endonuclease subunit Sen2
LRDDEITTKDGGGEADEAIEDLEHLQLTLQEAWFLIWATDCLTVIDPSTVISGFRSTVYS